MTDYEFLVRRLSNAYEKKCRAGHDAVLEEIGKEKGKIVYDVLKHVVVLGYIESKSASNRIFGEFPERDIRTLSSKCSDFEKTLSNTQ